SPAAISRPHPMIMIGGGGEKKTLRLVAKYADACNIFATSTDDVVRKLAVLREHCDAEGRDYDSIVKTAVVVRPVLADVDGWLALVGARPGRGIPGGQPSPDPTRAGSAPEWAERFLPRLSAI